MRFHVSDRTGAAGRAREQDAISTYLDAFEGDPDGAQSTVRAIHAYQLRRGLVVGGRPLCTVARPRFLARSRAERLGRCAGTLSALFERAGSHLLSSSRLLDRMGATELERSLWEVNPGYEGFAVTSRLDSFFAGDDPTFIEYNAESPAGIAFCDELATMFSHLPGMAAWEWESRGEWDSACRALLDCLLRAYREWGGRERPRIAILDWDAVVTRRDFELCAAYFWERGIETVIADPRSARYERGALWIGSDRIDLVYRRVLLHELLDHVDEVQPLLNAYREGAVCIVNSPRSKLLHKKTLFALLSDRTLGLHVSDEEADVLDRCIPWTRLVEEGETTFHGDRVDLLNLLVSRRDRFTVKPADEYGGKGVVLGWDVDEGEWQQAIERALGGGYIVQERVEVPRETYPMLDGGTLTKRELIVDANPLLFHGAMGAVLTRLSGSALLNVTAGTGSAAPTLLLHEEA